MDDGGAAPFGRDEEFVNRIVAFAPLALMVADTGGVITWVGGAVETLTGYTPEEAVGANVLDFIDTSWNPLALDSIGAAIARSGLQRAMLFRLVRKDGTSFVAEVQANSQWDDPVLHGMAVYIRPCDERMLLDRVVECLAAGSDIAETLGLLTQVMGAETLEGEGAVFLEADRDRPPRAIAAESLPPELSFDDGRAGSPWRRAMEAGAPVWLPVDQLPADIQRVASARGFRWCWAWPVAGPNGAVGCLVLWRQADEEPDHTCTMQLENLVRITGLVLEREQAAEQLRYAASHDPLTGLANRARFFETLQVALDGGGGPLVGVLYVDLDEFKPVNDRLGHGAGDQVLRSVGRRMRSVVRELDLVARLGGDEFAVLCPAVEDTGSLGRLAERLTAAVRDPITVGDHQVRVGA
ncbi:MAG TPA: diguanylate cyclase, partial [Acidimicrobiales bacterium]|nr:diguanylate cyclase [Acidimicrobiales bacterium]